MSPKRIVHGEESRAAIARGVDALAKAVAVTLGPKGRNVVIEREWGPPLMTKDGVTVAKQIQLEDPLENMGAQMVVQAASKTADQAGDGTTTATILAQAIFREGLKSVAAGANPMALKRGIDKTVAYICGEAGKHDGVLDEFSEPIDGKEGMLKVGLISANGDQGIAQLVADAIDAVGKEGIVTVESSRSEQSELSVVEGMQFDSGLIAGNFINVPTKLESSLDHPYVLCVDRRLASILDLQRIMEFCGNQHRSLLVVAEDIEGEALSLMIINHESGALRSCAVRAPGYGDQRKDFLLDLAVATGGQAFTDELGMKQTDISPNMLGEARRVVVGRRSTTIVEGAGDPEKIKARCEEIRAGIEQAVNDYDKDRLKHRLAKLSTGVAVIKVGAATQVEQQEKAMRVDDALHAVQAAVQEGVVPGGGVALLRCIALSQTFVAGLGEREEVVGGQIVLRALEEPLRAIAANAGKDAGAIIGEVRKAEGAQGYNAETDTMEDLVKTGVIDPTKVTRAALLNAASVASVMLTTEALISEIRKPVAEAAK